MTKWSIWLIWTLIQSIISLSPSKATPVKTSVNAPLSRGLQSVMDNIEKFAKEDFDFINQTFSDENVAMMFQDPALTYGELLQVFLDLTAIYDNHNHTRLSKTIPTNLLTVLPANEILAINTTLDHQDTLVTMTKHIHDMLVSQQHALFLNFIQEREKNAEDDLDASRISIMFEYLKAAPTGQTILSKFYGPKTFRTVLKDFLSFYESLPEEETKQRVIEYLPWSHRRVLFEEKKVLDDSNPGLPTLTCQDLNSISDLESFTKVSFFYEKSRSLVPFTPYSTSLLMCMHDKLVSFLKELKKDGEDDNKMLLEYLKPYQIRRLGGFVLSSFSLRELSMIKEDELALIILREIGHLSPIDIITTMSMNKAKDLTAMILERLNKSMKALDIDDLFSIGSLIFYLEGTDLEKISLELLNEFVTDYPFGNFHKIPCMTKDSRDAWARIISKTLGKINTWNETAVYLEGIGDLIMTLDEDQLNNIDKTALYYIYPMISNSALNIHVQKPPYFSNHTSIAEICFDWLNKDNSFMHDYKRMMRFLVQTAQLRINVQGALNNFTALNFSSILSRKKREDVFLQNIDRKMDNRVKDLLDQFNVTNGPVTMAFKINIQMKKLFSKFVITILDTFGLKYSSAKELNIIDLIESNGNSENEFEILQVTELISSVMQKATKQLVLIIGATHRHMNLDREEFCHYFMTICESPFYNYMVFKYDPDHPFGIEKIPDIEMIDALKMPTQFTCEGIKAAGYSAIALGREDFESWTTKELEDCIEFIGKIRWNLKDKTDILQMLEEKKVAHVSLPKISLLASVLLNRLLEPMVHDPKMLVKLSLSSVHNGEMISLVNQFPFQEEKLLQAIVSNIRDNSHPFMSSGSGPLKSSGYLKILAPMSSLACGLGAPDIETLLRKEGLAEFLLPLFGRINSCPNPSGLRAMARAAIKFYGSPEKWSSADIDSLGIIVAGLNPSEFAKIGSCCIDTITREAITHLTDKHLTALSEEKVNLLSKNPVFSVVFQNTVGFTVDDNPVIQSKVSNNPQEVRDAENADRLNRVRNQFNDESNETSLGTNGSTRICFISSFILVSLAVKNLFFLFI